MSDKLRQVTTWLDMPLDQRPSLILSYIPEVDEMGHLGGPDSAEVDGALMQVNTFVKGMMSEISRRNLTNIVDVVIVSDHGMSLLESVVGFLLTSPARYGLNTQ
jgi:predicted AlkP superfamily pyrophosphatase or phosphodiesterase